MIKYYFNDDNVLSKCTIKDEDLTKGAKLPEGTFNTFDECQRYGLDKLDKELAYHRDQVALKSREYNELSKLEEKDAPLSELVLDV